MNSPVRSIGPRHTFQHGRLAALSLREHAFSEVIGNAGRQAEKFEHEYENALKELLRKKQASGSNDLRSRPAPNVVNFMDALRQSGRPAISVRPAARSAISRSPFARWCRPDPRQRNQHSQQEPVSATIPA